ncbi:MAG: hypothetical protein R2941_25040 [Desulfobacterales bacterium]
MKNRYTLLPIISGVLAVMLLGGCVGRNRPMDGMGALILKMR